VAPEGAVAGAISRSSSRLTVSAVCCASGPCLDIGERVPTGTAGGAQVIERADGVEQPRFARRQRFPTLHPVVGNRPKSGAEHLDRASTPRSFGVDVERHFLQKGIKCD
jgi:hypothetical protein